MKNIARPISMILLAAMNTYLIFALERAHKQIKDSVEDVTAGKYYRILERKVPGLRPISAVCLKMQQMGCSNFLAIITGEYKEGHLACAVSETNVTIIPDLELNIRHHEITNSTSFRL